MFLETSLDFSLNANTSSETAFPSSHLLSVVATTVPQVDFTPTVPLKSPLNLLTWYFTPITHYSYHSPSLGLTDDPKKRPTVLQPR